MDNSTSNNQRGSCAHGVLLDTLCFYCFKGDEYFNRDADAYEEFYRKSSNVSFDLAFEVAKRFEFWKEATKDSVFQNYLKGVVDTKRLVWSPNTIKKAFYLTRDFPDLAQEENRKRPFSIYREIANSKITDSQKQELRAISERERLTLSQARSSIRDYLGIKKQHHKSETIIFKNEEDFILKVRDFISEHPELKEKMFINLTILKPKEEK